MAGIPFLHNIDLNDNQLLNAKLHTSGTAPSSPGTGTIWYDSDNSLVKIYNSGWTSIAGDITAVTSATTGQLTVASGTGPAPALTIVTGAIANGGSGLATADQIHTFVTGQTDAIAASTSGTAAIATAVTVADESSDTTCFPLFSTAATGNLGPKSGTNLTFNSSTGILTATGFAGPLTGNVTGNTSGTAATVTTAAQTAITSLGTLTGLTVSNTINITGGHLDLADEVKVIMGDGNDFQIYHDPGTESIDGGTVSVGSWIMSDSGNLLIHQSSPDQDIIFVNDDGSGGNATYMTLDGGAKTIDIKVPLNVGVDDAGHDVKFFGDTASKYLLWDASADKLIATGEIEAGSLDISGATTSGGDITLAATKALKFADDKIKIGDSSSTPGANGIQVGEAATASGAQAIAFGYDGNATGNQSIAMGYNPTASGTYSVAIGYNMTASGSGTVAIGTGETFSEADTLVTNLDMLARTGDGAILHLQTSDTTIEDGGVLGSIQFSAPLEGSGTDAILTGAEIVAVAEGDFTASSNATELLFKVGASEAAATALTIASSKNATFAANLTVGGDLTVNGSNTTVDSTTVAAGDNMFKFAKDNSANSLDIGWYGKIVASGTKYSGIWYDASTGISTPKFRIGIATSEPGSTATIATVGTLVGNLEGDITGDITGDVTGNADTATALATGRTIGMTGDVVWTSPSFDGSGNVTAVATIQANSVALGTDTTGNYVGTITAGTNGGITTTGATTGEGVAHTLAVDFASGAQTITGTQYKVVTANNLSARSISATIDKDNSTFASSPYKSSIEHGLATEDVIVQLFDSVTKATVYADVVRKNFAGTNSTNKVTVTFASVPTNDIEVLITGIKGASAGTVSYA